MEKVPEKEKTELKVGSDTEAESTTNVDADSQSAATLAPESLPFIDERFEVLSLIGKGGMGAVYKVKDLELDRILAVKVLQKELTADNAAKKRFEQETESARKLNHPNLVSVYNQGMTVDGEPYLVMDYLEGKSLAQVIDEEGALSTDRTLNIFIQICDALDHAHENGVIHRDIKPTNIILTSESDGHETARIVDFGIAKVMDNTARETHDLTQTGEVFGSPHYMSPEQCLGFMLKKESDVYSLGCSMYETLTGQPPFAGSNPIQLVVKHINDDVDGFAKEFKRSKKQKQLETVTLKCLSKEMEDRYPSARDLKEDLEKIETGKPIPNYSVRSKAKPAFTRRQLLIAFPVLLGCFVYGLVATMTLIGDRVTGTLLNFVALAILLPGMSALMLVGYEKFKEIKLGKSSGANWWQMLLATTTGVAGLSLSPFLLYELLHKILPLDFMHPLNTIGILIHSVAVPLIVASFLGWLLFRKVESTRAWKVSLQLAILTACVVALPVLAIPNKLSYIPENLAKATASTFPQISVLAREVQIMLSKHPVSALKDLARFYLSRGELEKAAEVYTRIANSSKNGSAVAQSDNYRDIAKYFEGQHEFEKAIVYVRKALAVLPQTNKNKNRRYNLLRSEVDMLLRLERYKEALGPINELLTYPRNWNGVDSYLVLRKANILTRLGRGEEAIKLLDKFLDRYGYNIDFLMLRARLLETLGKPDLANLDYRRLLDAYKAFGEAPNRSVIHLKAFLYAAFKCEDQETFDAIMNLLKRRGGSGMDDLAQHLSLPISGIPLNLE